MSNLYALLNLELISIQRMRNLFVNNTLHLYGLTNEVVKTLHGSLTINE